MNWLRRNPFAWYLVVFSAVAAWGITRHPASMQTTSAGFAAVSDANFGQGTPPVPPEIRRVAQRMLLR